jgi:hypothetical protein
VSVEWLIGKVCTRVYWAYPLNFSFDFETGVLRVDCLWRIVAGGRLVLTSEDHEQQFGLPAPRDAYTEATTMLGGRRVTAARLREETADLLVEFDGGLLLEVLSASSGYEPWQLSAPGVLLVAMGGGGFAKFASGAESGTPVVVRSPDLPH